MIPTGSPQLRLSTDALATQSFFCVTCSATHNNIKSRMTDASEWLSRIHDANFRSVGKTHSYCLWTVFDGSPFLTLHCLKDTSQACVIMPMLFKQLLMQIGLWCLCSSFCMVGMKWNTTQTRNHAHLFPSGLARDRLSGPLSVSRTKAFQVSSPKINIKKYFYI